MMGIIITINVIISSTLNTTTEVMLGYFVTLRFLHTYSHLIQKLLMYDHTLHDHLEMSSELTLPAS